ncbi:MAG: GAF domain-containing protein [Candidatus Latescibacteria bacterium]|nr:GAF domain-containing protein [bacterium]MBD3423704.1 GAF domain-containing protein [Candidatus Latescibacterota bacterium]
MENERKYTDLINVLNIRMIELATILVILYLSRELAGFTFPSELVVSVFLASMFLHFIIAVFQNSVCKYSLIGERITNGAAIAVDVITVLSIIYLTGTVWSPFLFIIALPLFFSTRVDSSVLTSVMVTIISLTLLGALASMELTDTIPHYSSYPGDYESIMNWDFMAGVLLILAGFMGLMSYVFNAYYKNFLVFFRSTESKIERSRNKIMELTRLHDISLGINSVISLETLLKMVCKEVTLLLDRSWSAIMLLANENEILDYVEINEKNTVTKDPCKNCTRDPLVREMFQDDSGLIIENVRDHDMASKSMILDRKEIDSFIAVPIISSRGNVGILMVGGEERRRSVLEEDLKLLTILSAQLASAIEKSRLYKVMDRRVNRLERENDSLRNSNKLKVGYISHLSHEFKTPLTSIKAYVESLMEHSEEGEFPERKEFLKVILNETERLIRMVNKVLDVSRIEFGQKTLKRENINLADLLADVESSLQPYLSEKNLELLKSVPDDIPGIDGDPDLVKQVFINIIGNAIKFSHSGGKIYIYTVEEPVSIKISIRDEGEGISEADIKNIFKRFYQAKTGLGRGVGLGLAIVKNIIEQHGGDIAVQSDIGSGTEFTFTLPKEHHFTNLLGLLSGSSEIEEEINEMFGLAVRVVAEVLSAKIVSIMIIDEEGEELFIKNAYGLDRDIVENTRVKVGSSIAGKVVETGKPMLIDNIEEIGITEGKSRPQYETKSLISVPIMVGSNILGVINVNNKTSGESFNEDDLALLKSLSMRISKVIERIKLTEDYHGFIEQTLHSLRSVLKIYEDDVMGRRKRVVTWAVKVAKKLNINQKEARVIQYVASVHDIGMTSIGDNILEKTLKLTAKEAEEIKKHTKRGAELIRPFEFVEMVSKIILFHHERIDGRGYPMGLKGDKIPLGARILSVLDAYNSMISDRPYREKLSPLGAIDELVQNSGTQFDATVVATFVDVLFDEGELQSADYIKIVERLRTRSGRKIFH